MALTLVTYPGNFRAFKALIAAEYAGVEIAVKDVDAKAAAKLSPTGKVPVLETPQGTIFESNAIARYVARHMAEDFPEDWSANPEQALKGLFHRMDERLRLPENQPELASLKNGATAPGAGQLQGANLCGNQPVRRVRAVRNRHRHAIEQASRR